MRSSHLHDCWRDYRRRQASVILAVLAYFPLVRWTGDILRRLAGSPIPADLVAAAWLTALVASATWFATFRCPSCSETFHFTIWLANPVSSRCMHCGFEKPRNGGSPRR